jgi:hypothetical protein
MNERSVRFYFKRKYGYTLYDADNIDLISDPDDQILACDLALERIGRIERSLVRSGKMTMREIRKLQKEVAMGRKANVR